MKGGIFIYYRIKNLREDADLTQTEISQRLNISQRAYSHYENGTRDIPTNILIALADFHNVSIDYLLERTNSKKINT
ncbi:MAG: helix-turn-helix transcriptional regulator [Lachnospiraceae bacterium]|nr:helix-turn-helix transcriptional regulator [Lachnospiraceae bacterium]